MLSTRDRTKKKIIQTDMTINRRMYTLSTLLLVMLISVFDIGVESQKPARIGPDGKPLLNRPILGDCINRTSHLQYEGHNYFLSWREPWNRFENWDWFNGRNFCREKCMDLVSFDTDGEFKLIAGIMMKDEVKSIHTSGRKCNFRGKGCEAKHLQPINEMGWFWAGANNKRLENTTARHPDAFWSETGITGGPQPDNHEGIKEGPIETEFDIGITVEKLQEFHDEACLAVLNNAFNDGIKWHDTACHFRSAIICEDSDQLINLMSQEPGGENIRESVKKTQDEVELESINLNEVEPLIRPPSAVLSKPNNPLFPPPPPPQSHQQQQFSFVQQQHKPAPFRGGFRPRHPQRHNPSQSLRRPFPPAVPNRFTRHNNAKPLPPHLRHQNGGRPQNVRPIRASSPSGFFSGLKNSFNKLF